MLETETNETKVDNKINVQGATYQCLNCGSALIFRPGTSVLYCEYCDTETTIDTVDYHEAIEIDYTEYADTIEEINIGESKVIACRSCGAEATFDENTKSTHCPYCATPLVDDDVQHVRMVQPSYLLPFQIPQQEVNTRLSKWIRSLWFAPNKLKRDAMASSHLQGMYVPCWTYDSLTDTTYKGERGTDYTVTVGSGKNRQTVTRTRWSRVSGQIQLFFDDVLISASKKIYQKLLNKIGKGGWDLQNLVEADDRFLSGFSTEKYTVKLQEGLETAKKIMDSQIDLAIKNDIGGDHQRISWKETHFNNITFKLILLPIYISSYSYRGKLYHFYVNGRNGLVSGDRPYSAAKIALAILGGLLLVAGVYYYANQ